MKLAVEALRPFGDVLQVGFVGEAAAEKIQSFHPNSHLILEEDQQKAEKARKWAEKHPTARVIEESWQTAEMGIFDAILFSGGERFVLEDLPQIEAEIAHFPKMRYTDLELETFCKGVAPNAKEYLYRFLFELEERGQIEPDQRKKMIQKYHLKGTEGKKKPAPALSLLLKCLQGNMRKGSRFVSLTPIEEEAGFIDQISANPDLEVAEVNGFFVIEKL